MESRLFEKPQRQSKVGVILIFIAKIFNLLKGFWALIVYFLFTEYSSTTLIYIISGLVILSVLVLIYSVVYYRNFLFHIDTINQAFVLEKGVFTKENIAIPFDRIQQVYTKRSILQRILNVDSFIIETAGSKTEEIKIQAISREEAHQLSTILIKEKQKYSDNTSVSETSNQDSENLLWTHKLSFLTLLKIGISTNYLRGLVLITGFFATIYNEVSTVSEEHSELIEKYFAELPGPMESVSIFMIVVVAVLMMSILITVIEVFIKYFNLQLTQTKDSLQLEMGIKTNTKVSLQPRRVQVLQVITNPVQKWLNLYEVRIAIANTENNIQKSKIKIPGLDEATVKKMNSFLYSDNLESSEKTFRPYKIILVRRIIVGLLPVLASYLAVYYMDILPMSLWIMFAVIYTILVIGWQILMFRSLELIISKDFIFKKYGVWNRTEERIETYKIQSISIVQPLWYRKRNLINIVFHTAGGDIDFRSVHNKILPYINYMFYKIESDGRSWM